MAGVVAGRLEGGMADEREPVAAAGRTGRRGAGRLHRAPAGRYRELHGLQDHHDALQLLLADPRLPEVANDVVVEFGNARYQDTMDRFIAGQPVADADLRVVWRNTTQSPRQTWDAPDASPSRAPDIQICTRLLLRVPIPTRVPNGGYANSHDCRVSCDQ